MVKKTEWLRRDAHTLAVCYCLFTREDDFRRELKALNCKAEINFVSHDHSAATVHKLERANGSRVAIVCLRRDKNKTAEQINALLVHEALHIWRWHCELIGEDKPSEEFEAYGLQLISQELMRSYKSQTSKSGK